MLLALSHAMWTRAIAPLFARSHTQELTQVCHCYCDKLWQRGDLYLWDKRLSDIFSRRHGKFRPTLMKLVSSNESSTVQTTVEEGIESYRDSSNPSTAIKSLSRLKGIGPATASLLLAVHYPEQVLFFSDEAYYWLCNKGQRSSLKYNMTEYERLDTAAGRLIRRLGVSAMDVEKVAYVLFKEEVAPVPSTPDGLTLKSSKRESAKREPAKPAKSRPAKRKSNSDKAVEDHGPVTRSKRNKAA